MTPTWTDETPAPPLGRPQGLRDWLRVLRRGVPILVLLGLGLALLLLVRLVEWPLFGARRPVTPYITVVVCRGVLRLLGLATRLQGAPMRHHGAFVANHASWLDIFVLNAARDVYFVSKAEVAGWPGIGLLARATGTVFIARDRREARAQTELFRTRLMGRHHLLFFPEGTSTDSRRVLPFKPTLFAACFDPALRDQVVNRVDALNLPSYSGFVQPKLDAVRAADGSITDVTISYPQDLMTQMLDYSGNLQP